MSNNRWPTVTAERPCPVCAHTNRCRIAPDSTAVLCWRNGGKVQQLQKSGENRNDYIRKANHRTFTASAGKPKSAYIDADTAIDAVASMIGGHFAAAWPYLDAGGAEVFRVIRFTLPDGEKQYRPIHLAKDGWRSGDPSGLLPLYRLNEIQETGPVWVTEGEKAADAACALGLPATTSAHGSSAAPKTDWTPLAGRDVLILPDADEPGRNYARDVTMIVTKLSPPARVKVVVLPGLPESGDVVEFVAQRPNAPLEEVRAEIEALAEAAPWTDAAALAAEPWPDPLPLPTGLPEVQPFDYDLLPRALRGFVEDIAQRMQCPPDYCAATAMIVAGTLIGRRVAIRPKRHDDWQVVPNLYGAMIGRPSLLKSPAMKEVLKPLSRLEIEAKQEHAKALVEHESSALVADATKKVQKEALKKAVRDGADAQALAEQMTQDSAQPPTRQRYVVNDTTVEKLGVILAENPNGVLVYADELIALLRSMDRDGHEGDRGFYLTAWAGDSRYTYDRIGRGTLDIEAAIVSIVGSIQPGVVADYLHAAVRGGRGDDGLMQRFQVTVYPDPTPTWCNVDRYPDADAKAAAHAAFRRLVQLTPLMSQAERDNYDPDAVPFLRFDDGAQMIFDAWRADLESRLRTEDLHPAIESHLAKYRSLIPSLALILHLLDGGIGPVNASATEKAVKWGWYLESHARRVYACVTEAPAVAARLLATRIRKGDVADLFPARDVYRMCWSGLDRDQTVAAIDVLLSLGWLEERTDRTAGRERTRYAINPKIPITSKNELTKPTKDPSVSFVSDVPEDVAVFDT